MTAQIPEIATAKRQIDERTHPRDGSLPSSGRENSPPFRSSRRPAHRRCRPLPYRSYASSATRTVSGGTDHDDPHQREISFDRFCGGAYRKIKISTRATATTASHTASGEVDASSLLQARQELTRLVLVGPPAITQRRAAFAVREVDFMVNCLRTPPPPLRLPDAASIDVILADLDPIASADDNSSLPSPAPSPASISAGRGTTRRWIRLEGYSLRIATLDHRAARMLSADNIHPLANPLLLSADNNLFRRNLAASRSASPISFITSTQPNSREFYPTSFAGLAAPQGSDCPPHSNFLGPAL